MSVHTCRIWGTDLRLISKAALTEKLGKQNLRSVYWLPMAALWPRYCKTWTHRRIKYFQAEMIGNKRKIRNLELKKLSSRLPKLIEIFKYFEMQSLRKTLLWKSSLKNSSGWSDWGQWSILINMSIYLYFREISEEVTKQSNKVDLRAMSRKNIQVVVPEHRNDWECKRLDVRELLKELCCQKYNLIQKSFDINIWGNIWDPIITGRSKSQALTRMILFSNTHLRSPKELIWVNIRPPRVKPRDNELQRTKEVPSSETKIRA